MQFDRAFIKALAISSLTKPRDAAAQVLALGATFPIALVAVGIAATLSAFLTAALDQVIPSGVPQMAYLTARPLLLAVLQVLGMLIFASLVTGIGRLFGGQGRLAGAMVLLAWYDVLIIGLQLPALLVMFALPFLAAGISMAVLAMCMWLLASFIAQLHGFASTGKTLGGMVGFGLLLGLLLLSLVPTP